MTDSKLLKKSKKAFTLDEYTLTFEGWKRVQKIEQSKAEQAFIAMWFDPKMNIAKENIIKAITDSMYIRQIIDNKEYNGFVVPEILSEIERSKFIVADFTGNRGGVYFEAGYAEGLRKPVIYTCSKGSFKKVHFDIKQKNFILWDTPEELYKRLYKRIDAIVGLNK